MEGSNKNIIKIALGITALVLVAISVLIYFYYKNKLLVEQMEEVVNKNTIYDGISIDGIDVGGLSKETAYDKIKGLKEKEFEQKSIILYTEAFEKEYMYTFFETVYNYDEVVKQAYDIAREGSLKERYDRVINLSNKNTNLDMEYDYNKDKIDEALNEIKPLIEKEARDATIDKEEEFVITDETIGIKLNIERSRENIINSLDKIDTNRVELDIEKVIPKYTREIFEKITTPIGTCYTKFNTGSVARSENLRVGSSKLNKTILDSGETLSLNEILEERNAANGYKLAPGIVNGELVPGYGGGVCQIATTLYNAAIRAEINIVSRKNHSLPVSYIPRGLDAAISGNVLDLQFENDTDYPIYIESYVSGNKLYANMYGYEIHEEGRRLEFEWVATRYIQPPLEKITKDNTMFEGEKKTKVSAITGVKGNIYKKIYMNDELISREKFSSSYYLPRRAEILVGTKKKVEETVVTEDVFDEEITSNETILEENSAEQNIEEYNVNDVDQNIENNSEESIIEENIESNSEENIDLDI